MKWNEKKNFQHELLWIGNVTKTRGIGLNWKVNRIDHHHHYSPQSYGHRNKKKEKKIHFFIDRTETKSFITLLDMNKAAIEICNFHIFSFSFYFYIYYICIYIGRYLVFAHFFLNTCLKNTHYFFCHADHFLFCFLPKFF